jgi:cytochrome c556
LRTSIVLSLAAAALLAGCEKQAAREGSGGNSVIASEETRVGGAEPETGSAAVLGLAVAGQDAKRIMHDRHEGMEEIGDAMKLVSRELKGDAPNLQKVREGAGTIARLAPQVSGWFPPGTGPDVGKTEAKAEIWQKPQDFAAKTRNFQQAAKRFQAAAQGNDLAAIRAAHGDLGKSCKACHDLYREEDH